MSNQQDLRGKTLEINGAMTVDQDGNVKSMGNQSVCGVLKTNYIAEKKPDAGVTFQSDVCVDSGKVLKTNCVDSKSGNGVQFKDDVSLDYGRGVKVGGTRVVSSQYSTIGNAVDSGGNLNVVNRVNSILAALRHHGLIQDLV